MVPIRVVMQNNGMAEREKMIKEKKMSFETSFYLKQLIKTNSLLLLLFFKFIHGGKLHQK